MVPSLAMKCDPVIVSFQLQNIKSGEKVGMTVDDSRIWVKMKMMAQVSRETFNGEHVLSTAHRKIRKA